MRKKLLYALNIIPMLLSAMFFKYCVFLVFFLLPYQLIITVVNTIFAKKYDELFQYNIIVSLSSLFGILVSGILYTIFDHYDGMGIAILEFEALIYFFFAFMFTGFSQGCFREK